MKKLYTLLGLVLVLTSCQTYLPHTGFDLQNAPIVAPIYRGNDTSAVAVKATYENTNINYNEFAYDTVINPSLKQFNSVSLEASWAKTHKFFQYGAGAFAYGGQYSFKGDNYNQMESYMGLGAKTMVGAVVNGRHISWQILNFQASAAYDMGDFANYRSSFYKVPSLSDPDIFIIPGEVITTSFAFSSHLVIGTQGDFSGGVYLGLVYNGYWYENKYEHYGNGVRVGPSFRYKGTQLSITLASSNYSNGTVQLGISQMF